MPPTASHDLLAQCHTQLRISQANSRYVHAHVAKKGQDGHGAGFGLGGVYKKRHAVKKKSTGSHMLECKRAGVCSRGNHSQYVS